MSADAKLLPGGVNESDVVIGDFYWVWIDPSQRHMPNQPPMLVVAQPWRHEQVVGGSGVARLRWEGCGTDEGVCVLSIVTRVARPSGSWPSALPGTSYRHGSIVATCEEGRNLRIFKSHTPSESITIEHADRADLLAAITEAQGAR